MKNIVFMVLLSFFLTNIIGCGGSESTTPVETLSLPLQKGYVIDSPVSGLDYECGDIQGVTDDKGMFECKELPVTFKIGNLTLGKISQIPSDKKVYPQDILGIKRTNFTDPRLVELTRFLQSLDDDGDIEKVIKITPDIKESFIQEQIFVKLDDGKLRELVESAGKTYVSKDAAISHLKDTIEKLITIDIYPKTITLALGEQTSLHAQGMYSNGIKRDITDEVVWSSSNPSVATINGENVEAKNVGTTTIKAELNGINKTVTLTVKKASLVTLEINATNSQLAAGTETKLYAQGIFTDNTTADLTDQVIWSSSDKSKATVDTTGTVKALAKGTVIITAKKGNISATQTLSISDAKLTGIELVPQTQNIAKGLSSQISVMGNYTDGQTQTLTSGVDFNSSDESIATIDANGNITAIKEGTVTINAKTGLYTAQATVTVTPPILSSIKINPLEDTNLPKGKTVQLSVSGTYSDKTIKDVSEGIQWRTSNVSIATIDSQGILKILKKGSITVTATKEKLTASKTITITDAVLTKIWFSLQDTSLPKGLTKELIVVGKYSDGTTQPLSTDLTFTSNDIQVATVDRRGKVTGIKEGTSTITVQSGKLQAQTTVTVTPAVITTLKITPSGTVSLHLGKSKKVTVTATYSDKSSKDVTSQVSWSIVDSTIFSIDRTGNIKTVIEGTSKVTARLTNKTATLTVTVLPPLLTDLTIEPLPENALPKGTTYQLKVVGTYSDGSQKDITTKVTYSSSMPNKLTVNSNGLVTAKEEGAANITAHTKDIYSSAYKITVTPAILKSITINAQKTTLIEGQTTYISASGKYTDGTTKDITTQVIWKNNYTSILTVTKNGQIEAKSAGTAYLTASVDNINSNTLKFKVIPNVITGMVITAPSNEIVEGKTMQLKAIGTYSNGTKKDITNQVTWGIDSHYDEIASLSRTGLLTAKSPGDFVVNCWGAKYGAYLKMKVIKAPTNVIHVSTTEELRQALLDAAQNGMDDEIVLAEGVYKTTDDGKGTFSFLDNETRTLTLKSDNQDIVTISGDYKDPILNYYSTKDGLLVLKHINFIEGNSTINSSGGITSNVKMTIQDCIFKNNSGTLGGAIRCSSYINVENSNFFGNTSHTFSTQGSTTDGNGGALYASKYSIFKNNTFKNNKADFEGGAIALGSGGKIIGSIFEQNYAVDGGSIYTSHYSKNSILISQSNFNKNIAKRRGGAVCGAVEISTSFFANNKSMGSKSSYGEGGGAIYTSSYYLNPSYISNSKFLNNSSKSSGGAISIGYSSNINLKILNSLFINNIGEEGDSIYSNGAIQVINSLFRSKNIQIVLNRSDKNVINNSIFINDAQMHIKANQNSVICTLKNNYIDLDKINIQSFKENNIYNNIILGFENNTSQNYQLTASSDLIDAGTTDIDDITFPEDDLAGNPRISGVQIDIGPYEFQE